MLPTQEKSRTTPCMEGGAIQRPVQVQVVDTVHRIITNIQAYHSDKRDSQSLPSVIEQTKKNFEANRLEVKEILADTGYSSGTALAFLEAQNIVGYIPNFGKYKPSRDGFIYNKEKDQ